MDSANPQQPPSRFTRIATKLFGYFVIGYIVIFALNACGFLQSDAGLGISSVQFRDNYNDTIKKIYASFQINKLNTEDDTAVFITDPNILIVGDIDKSSKNLNYVTVAVKPGGSVTKPAHIIAVFGAAIKATDQKLAPEDIGNILNELGLINSDIEQWSKSTSKRNNKQYTTSVVKDMFVLRIDDARKQTIPTTQLSSPVTPQPQVQAIQKPSPAPTDGWLAFQGTLQTLGNWTFRAAAAAGTQAKLEYQKDCLSPEKAPVSINLRLRRITADTSLPIEIRFFGGGFSIKNGYYSIYESDNPTSWKPIAIDTAKANQYSIEQQGRNVSVYINEKLIETFSLKSAPPGGRISLILKAPASSGVEIEFGSPAGPYVFQKQ